MTRRQLARARRAHNRQRRTWPFRGVLEAWPPEDRESAMWWMRRHGRRQRVAYTDDGPF